jgi:hypothetical protein
LKKVSFIFKYHLLTMMIKKMSLVLLGLLTLSGCLSDAAPPDGTVATPTPTASTPVDPTTLNWTIEGPTGEVASDTCAGPFFVVASAALSADYVLSLAALNTSTTGFYSEGTCTQSPINSITVATGSQFSAAFYINDSTTSEGEIISLTATGPGAEEPLANLDVDVAEFP